MKRIMMFATALALLMATASFAYEIVDVTNGGSIKGKIKSATPMTDPVIKIVVKPKPDPKETEQEKTTCGASQQAGEYILSPANEVKNVLVIVENAQKGKAAPKTDLVIDNKKCYFEPHVGIAYKGANFVIRNSDPILHNTNLGVMLQENMRQTAYNLALPDKDQVIKKPVRQKGLYNIKCDAHDWMKAFVFAAENPYVAVTDASGNFEIKDLPPGKYKVRIWHEGFHEVMKDVDVASGKASDLNVTLSK